jgi:hypothetical protein
MDGGHVVTVLPLLPAVQITDPYIEQVEALARKLDEANREYDRVDRYYSGDQPLTFMAPEVVAQVGSRLAPLVINWPETIVDSVNRRLKVEGFRLGQTSQADDELWRIWTANELDEESSLAHADALVHGITYLSVWGNPEDPQTPTITYESAHQVTVEYEPGGRSIRAALKKWRDGDRTFATLYLRDQIRKYESVSTVGSARWKLREQPLRNPLGAVPIVPMVNRGRLLNKSGRSELKSIAPLADAVNTLATGMMVTADFYLTPRRWATGLVAPSGAAGDMERLRAEVAAYWENAAKEKTWLAGEGVKFGQFDEADLAGFATAIKLLTSAIAAIGGLPPDDLGLNQVNPASAEARRAAETVLILRAREKHEPFGGADVRAMRLAIAARDGIALRDVPQEYKRMKTAWADPATPAIAQSMDAASKGKESGIYDTEAAQAVVGMSPVERAAMKARAAEEAARAATADVRAKMELARELVRTDGLTLDAAMVTVGLLQGAALNSAASQTPA